MKLPSLSLPLLITTATILLSPTVTDAFAFSSISSTVSSSSSSSSSSKIAATTSDNEDISNNQQASSVSRSSRRNIIAAAGTFFAGMGLTTQVAFATELPTSSLLLSGSDNIFELPKYSEASKNRVIEVDLDTVNKAVVDKEKNERFSKNIDVESKTRSNAVRKDEIKEEDRMEKMMRLADEERKERLAKDKADSKANRFNTF